MPYSQNGLKGIILSYVRSKYPDFVHKGEIDRYAMEAGFLSENAGRRCRELVKEGRFEVKLEKGKGGAWCAWYRWILPPPPKEGVERARELSQMGVF